MRQLLLILLTVCPLVTLRLGGQTRQRLTNLPHVYIETFSGRSITSKTTYVYARMWMVDEQDNTVFYDSLEIRGRGNSTWRLAKKPYKLKFMQKERLLGKGYAKAKKWTLLANHADKTLMRNALTSRLGQRLGMDFNPAARFVDLTLNGKYVGCYQISDHVDVRPYRVDIAEQDYPLTGASDITGGYLLEIDGFADFANGKTGFYTPQAAAPVRIHYPDEDELQTAQYNYIRNFVNRFEQLLLGSEFDDARKGYRPYVDSVSLANWYIATEVSGNIDGFYSVYFYKNRGDNRLYWGPLWDYDIAYGNDNRKGDTSQMLMKNDGFGSYTRVWIERLWEDPWFGRLIYRRYHEVVSNGLEDYMLAQIDSLEDVLQQSQELNYQLWGISTRAYNECVLYSSYSQYVSRLRSYVSAHISYLLTAFAQLAPPDAVTEGITNPVPEMEEPYALAYDAAAGRLHFGAADPSLLDFTVRVHTAAGRLIGTFHAADGFSLKGRPESLLIASWQCQGQTHSVKFSTR